MKKNLAAALLVVIIGVVVIYFLIPNRYRVSSSAIIKANQQAVLRSLVNQDSWKRWWPKHSMKNQNRYAFNGLYFKIGAKQFDGMEVIIGNESDTISSVLKPSDLSVDSVLLTWTATVTASANPVQKLNGYFRARKLTHQLNELLQQFKRFAEKTEHLYGIDVKQTTVTDTILMVIKKEETEKPTIAEGYKYIDEIRNYIAKSGARETNYPMLNIRRLEGKTGYELMVAIPTDRHLPGTDMILWKRMIPGNILYADVKGGEATVEAAMKQMEAYALEHQRQSPALPYQLLVTDRMSEKDTTKWVTRIYYPVL